VEVNLHGAFFIVCNFVNFLGKGAGAV